MIREATLRDIPALVEFLKPFHEEGEHKDISINPKFVTTNLKMMLSSPMHKIWVVVKDGDICASLGVVSTEFWFSKRHYATNLFLCANDKGKGTAGFLLKKFKKWVDSRPIIKDASLITGGDNSERIELLYKAVGFTRSGGYFRLGI